MYQIWRIYLDLWGHDCKKWVWPTFGCKLGQIDPIVMQLKLDMSCHLLNAYTKFQIDISKHVEEKSGKRGRTDGRTDGRTLPRHNTSRFSNGRIKKLLPIDAPQLAFAYCWYTTAFLQNLTRQIWGIWKLRLAYSPETPNLVQNRWCFVPCDLEIWWMTLENNRAPLLCCFKVFVTFHSHRWIQTVAVRKRPIWVKFDDF